MSTPTYGEIKFGAGDLRRAAVLLREFTAVNDPGTAIYNAIVTETNELERHDALLVALLHLVRDLTQTSDRADLERGFDRVVHRYAALDEGDSPEGSANDD